MCPSGNVKVFSAGAAGFAAEADSTNAGTALAAGATAPAVEAGAKAGIAMDSVVSLMATFREAAAGSVPDCGAHPASTRLTVRPAIVTTVKYPVRLEFIFCTPNFRDGGLNVPLDR
jgi:hypothetical protein